METPATAASETSAAPAPRSPVHPFTPVIESPPEADDQLMPWESFSSPEPETEPETEPVHAEAQEEDFPWLSTELAEEPVTPAGAAPAEEPAPAQAEPGGGDLPDWLSWGTSGDEPAPVEPAAEAPVAAGPAGEEAPAETPITAADWEIPGVADFLAGEEDAAADEALMDTLLAEELGVDAPAPEVPVGAEAVPGGAGGVDRALAEALDGVADRLEQIARALRDRPEEVLSGGAGADPLQLLVTGFVLGYAQGQGRSGG